MSSLHKEQNIVLFESSTNLKNIEKFISKNDSIIITFDYKSHELLTLRKVSHKVSDSFLDEKDIHFLQKETYRLTKWFETKVSDSITYGNINLGELFYIDLYFILLPAMKKFFEIIQINKKYPNANFFASSIHYEMTKQFSKSVISLGGKKLSPKFGELRNKFTTKPLGIMKYIENLNTKYPQKEPLDPVIKLKLDKDFYPVIKELEIIINRNLSTWYKNN